MNITQSTVTEYAHVYSGDEAIDRTIEGWRELYDRALETGNLETMPLVAGKRPGVWWLKHPADDLRRQVLDDTHNLSTRPMTAQRHTVALLLVRVDGVTADGKPFEIKRERNEVTADCLNIIGSVDRGALIAELAERAYMELVPSKN